MPGVVVLVLLVVAVAAPVPALAGASSAERTAQRELSGLLAEQARLEGSLDASRDQIVATQASYAALQGRWEEAQRRYTAHLVERYKNGGQGDGLSMLLGSRTLVQAIDAAEIARQVGDYEHGLVRDIEAADAASQVDRDRVELVAMQAASMQSRLDEVNARIDRLRSELGRRRADRLARLQRQRESTALAVANPAAGGAMTLGDIPATGPFAFQQGLSLGGLSLTAFHQGAASAAMIDAYLASKGSPMVGTGYHFMLSGQRWGLDPRLLVAIAGAESSFGSITCGDFNAWGWSCPGSPVQFSSWATGIDTVAEGLRRYYVDEGRTTVVLIQQKYAPSGASNDPTGLNNHWVANVSRFLVEQGGNPAAFAAAAAPAGGAPGSGGGTGD